MSNENEAASAGANAPPEFRSNTQPKDYLKQNKEPFGKGDQVRLHLSDGEKPLLKVESVNKTQQGEKIYWLRYDDKAKTVYKDGQKEWLKRDELSDPKAQ